KERGFSTLTPLQQRVAHAAAVTHKLRIIEDGSIQNEEDEAELYELLAATEIDAEDLRSRFEVAYRFGGYAEDQERPAEDFSTFGDMAEFWDAGRGDLWDALVVPVVDPVYEELKAAGLHLPELGPDG